MALHAGEAAPDAHGDYLAAPLNRLARLLAAGHGGQILLAQTVQQLTRGALPAGSELRDLGEHRLRDLLEPERVYQLLHPDLPTEFPPLKSLESRPNNLPRQPTPFLGREREVGDVVGLLRKEDVQLLTLVGPGGTGKTRLALQAAAELLEDFADGVFLVELAPLADAGLVPSSIVTALGLQEGGNQSPEESVKSFLKHKTLLLLLDNFEHLLEAAPVVGRLLNTCPTVKVLATSRAPLRLRSERLYPVPPLTTPDANAPEDREAIARSEAVQLFVERAQASDPSFLLTPEAVPAIADIVRRLDGLPLAIELAATRVRLLPPAALLDRLEQRLPLLTGGARDAPERQRTLRATIAWSHDLLSKQEQTLFRRLAVFTGGYTLDAVEVVTNASGELDILGGIASLVDHSLVRQGTGVESEPRFTMLETINEFALERLTESGDDAELRRQHAQYFLALAETAYDHRYREDQAAWNDRLEVEHPNLRAALQWSRDTHDSEVLMRLAGVLGDFWSVRAHHREGAQWLEQALAGDASPSSRLRCLLQASGLAYQQGNNRRATKLAEEALALAQHGGSAKDVVNAQQRLGHALLIEGDLQQSQVLLTKALSRYRTAGDALGAAHVLTSLAELAWQQRNLDQTRTFAEEALPTFRAVGEVDGTAFCLLILSMVSAMEGDGDRALILVEEAIELWHGGGITFMLGLARTHLGELLADHRGDDVQAESLLREALSFWQQAGNNDFIVDVLLDLGHIARRRGDLALAEARYQEIVAVSQELEDPISVTVVAVKGLLGLAQVARARAETAPALDYVGAALERLCAVATAQWDSPAATGFWLKRSVAECLHLAACTAGGGTKAVGAARAFGAAAAWRTASRSTMLRAEQARADLDAASVRAHLSETAFSEAWAAGMKLSVQEAIAEALVLIGDMSGETD
jgi:predicted ATPase